MTLIIVGAGQTGRLFLEVIRRRGEVACVGFLDADPALHGREIDGVPVLGGDDLLAAAPAGADAVAIAVGNLRLRRLLFRRACDLGYHLPPIIDPSANLASSVRLGAGVFVSMGSTLLNATAIGDLTLIGTGVNVLHDTVLGANCLIGGGATIGAEVTMEEDVFVGVGAVLASGRKRIGAGSRIGAGAVVIGDVPAGAFLLGNPARVIGKANEE
ncbi:NeuD/PglB/VioB family sugar acetyltransferase [Phaeospirillum tilakii]|uniref:NeuD/PglB/VioB family sugar acetyltransferase n=1 Tax=Phaeospirillum tilakii TaxID=741673 RepID=A0ABW5CFB2_9PROT